MTTHQLHPVDNALAELGMLVRRTRANTLTQVEFNASVARLRPLLARPETDPHGFVAADLDMIVERTEADALDRSQFLELADRMRDRLKVARGEPRSTVVPIRGRSLGRPVGRLTVFDNDRHPHH